MSKSNLAHLGPTFHLLTRVVQVAGCHRSANSVYRTRLSQGVRLPRELQLKTARRVFEWRDLLLDEGTVRAGRTLAHPLQHRQTELVAGLQPRSACRVADRSIAGHGKAGSKERFQLFHAPDYGDEPYPLRAALR